MLAPAPCGWRAAVVTACGETSAQEASSFAEAVAAGFALAAELRADKAQLPVFIALPARHAVFERLTLPSADREELMGMVRLQFEKSLPYPVEEMALGLQILSQTSTTPTGAESSEPVVQTTLLACGVHHDAAASLCAPLLERQFPQGLTLWAMHMAAQAAAGEVACGLWREEDDLVFAIFENQHLSFVEILSSTEEVRARLPRTLMSAEMTGVPTDFREVLLDPSLAALAEPLTALLGAPTRTLDIAQTSGLPKEDAIDLTPDAWIEEQSRKARFCKRRSQLAIAAAVYGAALVAAMIFVGVQAGQLESLRKQAAILQPRVDTVIDQQTRWKALAPAIDQRRFIVELLFQTYQCLPTPDTRITRFDLTQSQFMVEGETPNAQQSVEFGGKLKERPELSDFRFESGQPTILANEHAQFRIFGKL